MARRRYGVGILLCPPPVLRRQGDGELFAVAGDQDLLLKKHDAFKRAYGVELIGQRRERVR